MFSTEMASSLQVATMESMEVKISLRFCPMTSCHLQKATSGSWGFSWLCTSTRLRTVLIMEQELPSRHDSKMPQKILKHVSAKFSSVETISKRDQRSDKMLCAPWESHKRSCVGRQVKQHNVRSAEKWAARFAVAAWIDILIPDMLRNWL